MNDVGEMILRFVDDINFKISGALINFQAEFFNEDIIKIYFIKIFAIENKITYKQAKEIFEQRYSISYRLIMKYAEKYKVPLEIIIGMIYDEGISFKQINDDSINKYIYEVYVKDINKDVAFIKDYKPYVRALRNRIMGFPGVIERMQARVKEFALENNVSTVVATLCCYYEYNLDTAKEIEKILIYNEKNNIKSSHNIFKDYINYLKHDTFFKKATLHGITIYSKTEDGLERLVNIVKKAFLYGKDDYKTELEILSNKYNLILTDYYYDIDTNASCDNHVIYISSDYVTDLVDTFFHESSHFIDDCKGRLKKYYSEKEDKVRLIYENIRVKTEEEFSKLEDTNTENSPTADCLRLVTGGIIEKGILLKEKGLSGLADDYINNLSMIEKWKQEIIEEYDPKSKEELSEYLFQKKMYEKDKFLRLINRIYDIYDGLSKGELRDLYNTPGHGLNYYHDERNDVLEFIANIGVFYNNDCIDILIYEFGEEITSELMKLYKDLLRTNEDLLEYEDFLEETGAMKVS